MKVSVIGWLVVMGIAFAAFFHHRSSVRNACEISASLLAPQSPTRQNILDYTLYDAATHRPVKLSDLKGKYKAIYVDVFASWCGPCHSFIPHVRELNAKLKDKGVLVVGLDISDEWDAMQRDISENHIDYLVLHDDGKEGGIHNFLKIQGIPTAMILDGKTLEQKARWMGGDDDSERDRVLAELGVIQ